MNFLSDNTAAAAPEMLAAIAAANIGAAAPYGEDAWSLRLNRVLAEVFEREVGVFLVATGTGANAIALASITPPWGAVVCHREAHIECDECGAPEFYSAGAKLVLVDGPKAKVSLKAVEAVLRRGRSVHSPKPSAISISQASERGALYSPVEIGALGEAARAAGMMLHMDGARFANAVAALGCAPADLTWRAGIDVMSLGATKNGALGAEAIVVFDRTLDDEIARRRKRGGHLMSKCRYAAAQLVAYFEEGKWLKWAAGANASARRLGEAAAALLTTPVETNQVFVKLSAEALALLRSEGVGFYDWGEPGHGEVRLVTSWDQAESELEAMAALLRRCKSGL